MSTAAYLYSGQVWTERWDSAMTTTPEIPNGLNSWKTTSTMVACALFAASTSAPFTFSMLLMASESQSNNSSSRCRPRAFNPLTLLCPIRPSTAPLLRRAISPLFTTVSATKNFFLAVSENWIHCRGRFRALQEKNAVLARLAPPDTVAAPPPPPSCAAPSDRQHAGGAATPPRDRLGAAALSRRQPSPA